MHRRFEGIDTDIYNRFEGLQPSRYIQLRKSEVVIRKSKPVESEIHGQTHGSYGALLFDSRWRSKRLEILARDKHQCVLCHSSDSLQVHHRQYHFIIDQQKFKAPWDYLEHLLITLCEKCHQRGHSQFKIPIIKI